jgi:hypothetical protein
VTQHSSRTTFLAVILLSFILPPNAADARHPDPLSVGVHMSNWPPALTAYNDMFEDQSRARMVNFGPDLYLPIRIRTPLDSVVTFFRQTQNENTYGPIPLYFKSDMSIGLSVEIHSPIPRGLIAEIELDRWSQTVGSMRSYGGMLGYEEYSVTLHPQMYSLLYELRMWDTEWFMPDVRFGGGIGILDYKRTIRQVTLLTPPEGVSSSNNDKTWMWSAQLAAGISPPQLGDRVTISIQTRYTSASYTEQLAELSDIGTAMLDDNGDQIYVQPKVDVGGWRFGVGAHVNFGRSIGSLADR